MQTTLGYESKGGLTPIFLFPDSFSFLLFPSMRRLFAFALSSIRSYITVDIAGVGKRKVMQKGAFAYKADEKCIS